MSVPSSAPLPSFSPDPFQPDGGCSVGGLILLGGSGVLSGLVLGALAGFVSQWFYLIILFPVGIGLGVGAVGAFAVKSGKVRMPLLCGAAGFLGGCVAVVAMHYYEYHTFEEELAEVSPDVRKFAANFDQLQAKRAELSEEDRALLDDLAKDPQIREALAVNGFISHLDLMAHRGVTISSKRGQNPINLGYTGSYIYWGVEAFIIAAIAFVFTNGAAAEPFCSQCESWKTGSVVGGFDASITNVKEALGSGDLNFLAEYATPNTETLPLTLFRCPTCQFESPIDARLETVTVNKKGEKSKSTLCTVTYPAEASEAFELVFRPKSLPFETASDAPSDPA